MTDDGWQFEVHTDTMESLKESGILEAIRETNDGWR
jgi:hypothetical protein